ncbi:MAG: pitrilysin family protein [Jaaginema sp. PMC 1079.18]|nr:pitrilysin family protein [Jaaginema sp. PMC 1080.18]MEC4851016.1 pitrilysin family protein [Jaaginema sp. PMC 1079.18]MEC4868759.1 pitrilysin family protein [Jaaginema sp. PMC 1078.18]
MTSVLVDPPKLNAPTIRQLDDGLTIIAEQMPVAAVNLNLWFNIGSVVETDPINGMAHFLEHMMFKGTPHLSAGEFEKAIEERGAVTNAATSQEYTHYYITTAPQDFATLAPLQFEVVTNPQIEDMAFERERLVVLEEIRRSDDNPSQRTFRRAIEACFETLPYRRPVLGFPEAIAQFTPQQMRSFHAQWYRPQTLTAAVVGNLPVEELIEIVTTSHAQAEVQRHRGRPPVVPIPHFEPEPAFREVVRQEYTDARLQQARLIMLWRVPGMLNLADTYALDVLAAVLGQGKMSRLFRDLREDRKLVTSIGASNITKGVQGMFYIGAQLPSENVARVEEAIAQHLERFHTELIPEIDLARIRTKAANRFVFGNERPSDRANLYGYYYSQMQDLTPALTYTERLQAVTVEDVRIAAQRYLTPEAFALVVVHPELGG